MEPSVKFVLINEIMKVMSSFKFRSDCFCDDKTFKVDERKRMVHIVNNEIYEVRMMQDKRVI